MPFANAKREKVGMRKKVMIVEDNELSLKLFTDLCARTSLRWRACAMDGWRWNTR
jgi:hypothetical protein